MPEISYKELKKYLQQYPNDPLAPVVLIYGEELLAKGAFDELLDVLVPPSGRSINYDLVDGTRENIHEVIARVKTFSLMPGRKVVALRNSRIFYTVSDKGRLLENTRKAHGENDIKKAAGYFLSMMGHLHLSFEDVAGANRAQSLGLAGTADGDDALIDDILAYCLEKGLSVPSGADDSRVLQRAVENGFPEANHLVITTDVVDKRRGLYKAISSKGLVIDCSVPKGARRADRMAQQSVLVEKMKSILAPTGKTMDQAVYMALFEMTGFDLSIFSSNLEKLINYTGERSQITTGDVQAALKRSRKDPVYELTNALAERRADQALFFLGSMLASDLHPLQVLAALVNQVRKLLLIRDFMDSPYGRQWQTAGPYDYFRQQVVPAMGDYDRDLLDRLESWQGMLAEDVDLKAPLSAQKKKTRKKTLSPDLMIAGNPKNAYPIFQLFKKARGFTKDELVSAVGLLHAADRQFKSGAESPKLILEKVILEICDTRTGSSVP
jgi:DNA polymerase-3 subunit delta